MPEEDFYTPSNADALRRESELLAFEIRFLKARLAEAERAPADLQKRLQDAERTIAQLNEEAATSARQKARLETAERNLVALLTPPLGQPTRQGVASQERLSELGATLLEGQMKPAAGRTDVPVIYAGRFSEGVSESLPKGKILNEWEVLPHQLADTLRRTPMLMVLDLLSFPFEAMTDEQRDIPLLVTPPPGFDAETLITVFGPALFEHLGPFDRVATATPETWDTLRKKYSWANGQYVKLKSNIPGQAANELRTLLESSSENLHHEKAAYRAEARALASRLKVLQQDNPSVEPLDVLEVGVGASLWPTSFDLSRTNFSGVYTADAAVEAVRRDFPEHTFAPAAKDHKIAQSSGTFNLSFSVNFMQVQPDFARRVLVSEMWRVTRPGGSMIFVEDFVGGRPGGEDISSMSISGFVELVVEATAGRVVLDHVESLLYPGEDMFRGALISLQKLGGTKDE